MIEAFTRLSQTATWAWTTSALTVSATCWLVALATSLPRSVEGYAALAVPALMAALAFSLGAVLGDDAVPITRPLPLALLFVAVWALVPGTILARALVGL